MSKGTKVAMLEDDKLPTEFDFGDNEGDGFEGVDNSHLATPSIIVLQSNSPQCKPVNFGGVEGAKPGMFYNQGTGQLFDGETGVGFIAASIDHQYVEFFPKEDDGSGGGFVGVREVDDDLVVRLRSEQSQFGKLRNNDGVDGEPTELIETYSLIGYTVTDWNDPGTASRAVVSFASTKISGYKKFMSMATDIKYMNSRTGRYQRPPLWSHRYTMRTIYKQKGTNAWYVIGVQFAEMPKEKSFLPQSHPLFQLGSELHQSFVTGATKVEYEKMESDGHGGDSTDTPF